MACYYSYYPVLVGEDKSVSKKSTQKTFPPSEEKSFAPIKKGPKIPVHSNVMINSDVI